MSNDKEKLSQLSTRVDELLNTINKITEELRSISATLKLLAIAQTQTQPKTTTNNTATTPKTQTTTPKTIDTTPITLITNSTSTTPSAAQTETKLRSIDDVRMSFPEDLEKKLDFEDKGEYITIKLKQFLGSDNFAKIASTARGMNGEYISAGKDSHFRIPKKKI
ncbi:MAG: hypothetical protein FWE56_01945 [Candidatus Bathyarchaeota archaeon]|nr:hypothetical protein [Candidatus Termiticorpusculum sp.]MCL2868356.1 hypothetical protein [Candidatus Termiticorpusculum sp.]